MTPADLPPWAAIPASLLLVLGGLLAAIGSLGLLRMRDFRSRMHPPAMGATLGAGSVLVASMIVSSARAGAPVIHEVLITVFLVLSAPIPSMLLMRAAAARDKRHGRPDS